MNHFRNFMLLHCSFTRAHRHTNTYCAHTQSQPQSFIRYRSLPFSYSWFAEPKKFAAVAKKKEASNEDDFAGIRTENFPFLSYFFVVVVVGRQTDFKSPQIGRTLIVELWLFRRLFFSVHITNESDRSSRTDEQLRKSIRINQMLATN